MLDSLTQAGLLRPLDFEIASRLGRLGNEDNPSVLLAAALASWTIGRGNTCLELGELPSLLRSSINDPELLEATNQCLQVDKLLALLAESPLVGSEEENKRPLILDGGKLYLHRFWSYQRDLADRLLSRATTPAAHDPETLEESLKAVFPDGPAPEGEIDLQRLAAITAVLRTLCIVAGGPGTGKTFTVRRILMLLIAQWQNSHAETTPRILLLAPTGKAANRMAEAIQEGFDASAPAQLRVAIPTKAQTIHQVLRINPTRPNRPRFHAGNPLPADIIIIDEASMIDLELMTQLMRAITDDTRIILLGDPDQLASVSAGAVLYDLCTIPYKHHPISEMHHQQLSSFVPELPASYSKAGQAGLWDCVVQLNIPRRFDTNSGIFALASAVNNQETKQAAELLNSESAYSDIELIHRSATHQLPQQTKTQILQGYQPAIEAAQEPGNAVKALEAGSKFRILCAHREGRNGVDALNQETQNLLAKAMPFIAFESAWYAGRPILITKNDPQTGLRNGEIGIVVVGTDDTLTVAFPPESATEAPRLFAPSKLPAHETVFAMTIHKSQGSQFEHIVLGLPEGDSGILTKELLYTGITRAQKRLTLVCPPLREGKPHPLKMIIGQRIQRVSGLHAMIWNKGLS